VALDISVVLGELAPLLNAASTADSDFLFWTAAELYQFCDDAIKEAARKAELFVTTSSIRFTAAQATKPLNAIAVIAAAWNNSPLREANVSEVEALDDAWETTPGTPSKWLQDVGLGVIRTYPTTQVAGTLSMIAQTFPADISTAQTMVEAPAPFAGYLLEAMLGRAREKQSDAMMPEVAEHANQRLTMYQQIFEQYWGAGE
jgi:hypothetical protein